MINEYPEGDTNDGESNKRGGSYNSTPTLNQFGNDLTKAAREGKLDPVIGRSEETRKSDSNFIKKNKE